MKHEFVLITLLIMAVLGGCAHGRGSDPNPSSSLPVLTPVILERIMD